MTSPIIEEGLKEFHVLAGVARPPFELTAEQSQAFGQHEAKLAILEKWVRKFAEKLLAEGERRGREAAVEEVKYAIGLREGKITVVPRNFLQTLLDALEEALKEPSQ